MQTVITDWEPDSELLPSTYMIGKIFIISVSRQIYQYFSFECQLCRFYGAKRQNMHLTYSTPDLHSAILAVPDLTQMIPVSWLFFTTLLIFVGSLYVQGCQRTEFDQADFYSWNCAAELEW